METFEYVAHDGNALQLDVHPAAGPATPSLGTVVYIHGGAFAVGDRGTDAERVLALAQHGLTVVVPDYRLAPDATFPNPVDDVRAAIKWIRDHPEDVGTTSSRVGLWGASAGGVLARLAALMDPGSVQAVVTWFGFSDITTSASRSPLEAAILPRGAEHNLLGVDDLDAVPELVAQASPLTHVSAAAPPFLIAHGDRDHVVSIGESQQLHAALTRAGADSTLTVLGGAGHEDPRFDSAANIAMTAAFLRSHLGS